MGDSPLLPTQAVFSAFSGLKEKTMPTFSSRRFIECLIFALVYFFLTGECWSDPKAEQKYNKHGASEKCFKNYNQTCPPDSNTCAGGKDANFVYRIVMSKSSTVQPR